MERRWPLKSGILEYIFVHGDTVDGANLAPHGHLGSPIY